MTSASDGAARRDVVVTFPFGSWGGPRRAGSHHAPDRLVATLMDRPDIGKLVIANGFRWTPAVAYRWVRGRREAQPTRDGATAVTPRRWRRHDPSTARALAAAYAGYDRQVRQAADAVGAEGPAVITTNPLVAGFADFDWAGPVTYYAFDDWAAHPAQARRHEAIGLAYAQIRRRGRRVVSVSEELQRRLAPTGPARVVPNGVVADEWARPGPAPAWFTDLGRPVVLYVGKLDDRVDVGLVARVAGERPDLAFVLVGPLADPAHYAPLADAANVQVGPQLERPDLVASVAHAAACWLPHRRTELTRAMSPLKVYEYLAGGAPVAAVDLPPVHGIDPAVVIAEPDDLGAALDAALARGRASEADRQAFVAANAWPARHDELLDLALAD